MKKSKLINPDPSLQNNLMAFGYECDKGWWPLIDECVAEIEKQAEREKIDVQILQVKEKFGGLRIYVSSGTNKIDDIIDRYEILADHLCETCGSFCTAKLRVCHGWYKTLCSDCAQKLGYE
jgi:hypothetical protein